MEENKNDVAVLEPPHEIEEASSVEDTNALTGFKEAEALKEAMEKGGEAVATLEEEVKEGVGDIVESVEESVLDDAEEVLDKETQALFDTADEIAKNPDEFIPVPDSEFEEDVKAAADSVYEPVEDVLEKAEAIEEQLPEEKKSLFKRAINKIKSWFTR